MILHLFRKKNNDDKWLSCTKGDAQYVLQVLKMNVHDESLVDFEWKITPDKGETIRALEVKQYLDKNEVNHKRQNTGY